MISDFNTARRASRSLVLQVTRVDAPGKECALLALYELLMHATKSDTAEIATKVSNRFIRLGFVRLPSLPARASGKRGNIRVFISRTTASNPNRGLSRFARAVLFILSKKQAEGFATGTAFTPACCINPSRETEGCSPGRVVVERSSFERRVASIHMG